MNASHRPACGSPAGRLPAGGHGRSSCSSTSSVGTSRSSPREHPVGLAPGRGNQPAANRLGPPQPVDVLDRRSHVVWHTSAASDSDSLCACHRPDHPRKPLDQLRPGLLVAPCWLPPPAAVVVATRWFLRRPPAPRPAAWWFMRRYCCRWLGKTGGSWLPTTTPRSGTVACRVQHPGRGRRGVDVLAGRCRRDHTTDHRSGERGATPVRISGELVGVVVARGLVGPSKRTNVLCTFSPAAHASTHQP